MREAILFNPVEQGSISRAMAREPPLGVVLGRVFEQAGIAQIVSLAFRFGIVVVVGHRIANSFQPFHPPSPDKKLPICSLPEEPPVVSRLLIPPRIGPAS